MSKPFDFNDPWDCRPCFDTSRLSDPTIREQTVQFFERSDRAQNRRSEQEYSAIGRRLREDPAFLEAKVSEMTGIETAINERYRVYSLAERADIPLMWSHYGNKHSGVCLEFAVDNSFLSRALRVEYCTQYPSLGVGTPGLEVLLPLLTKSADWSYECEYRLIGQERAFASAAGQTLYTDDHWISFPAPTLKSVIVGCMMTDPDRDELRSMVAGGSTTLKQAVRISN